MSQLTVSLSQFEGPLALLLYLIRKEEMDIMNINIHEITGHYLDYIKLMKELDLEVAGEFIAMASTLIQIKSRMLLPQYDENGEIIENDDPRKELVQKLLEYQKYQEAAKTLYERPLVGRDLWLRGKRETLESPDEEIELEENALFSLIGSYRKIMKAAKKRVHQVAKKVQSIASRVLELKDRLLVGVRVNMMDLIDSTEDKTRQVLITFLSVLELGKMGIVSIYQSEPYSDLWIEATKSIEGDVVSRVEEYDNLHAEEIAEKMISKSEKEMESDEEFILTDAEDNQQLVLQTDQLTADVETEEMASDDEILAAENDMKIEGMIDERI